MGVHHHEGGTRVQHGVHAVRAFVLVPINLVALRGELPAAVARVDVEPVQFSLVLCLDDATELVRCPAFRAPDRRWRRGPRAGA